LQSSAEHLCDVVLFVYLFVMGQVTASKKATTKNVAAAADSSAPALTLDS